MNIIRMKAHPDCILCGVGSRNLPGTPGPLFGVPGTFNIRQCPSCGLLWLDPRPEDEDLPKCYINYYTHQVPRASVLVARDMSGFVAHDLSGLLRLLKEVTFATDRVVTGDSEDEI